MFWTVHEVDVQKSIAIQKTQSTANNAADRLKTLISDQYLSAHILSHSLSLRRYIIEIGQKNILLPRSTLQSKIRELGQKWKALPDDAPAVQAVCNTLEARYLRDIAKASDDLIDTIEVTDVFGVVRVASKRPEEILMFDKPWWQITLQMAPDMIYHGDVHLDSPVPLWDLSIPLKDDEGKDAVGMIRIRINVDKLFERTLSHFDLEDVDLHLLTDKGIYPTLGSNVLFSISQMKSLRYQRSGYFKSLDGRYVVGYRNIFEYSDPALPHLDWVLFNIRPSPVGFSLHNQIIQDAFLLWLASLLVLTLVSLMLARWISVPLLTLTRDVQALHKGHLDVRIRGEGYQEIRMLARTFNELLRKIKIARDKVKYLLDRSTESLTSISEFALSFAENQPNEAVCSDLLKKCKELVKADTGIVMLRRSDESANHYWEKAVSHKLNKSTEKDLIALIGKSANRKQLFYAWVDDDPAALWKRGYQVLMLIPINSQALYVGMLALLFWKAPDIDLESDSAVDVMALQAGIKIAHNDLSREMESERNKLSSIVQAFPSLMCTIDRSMSIVWTNQYTRNFLGLDSPPDFTGKKCYEVFRNRKRICPDCPTIRTFRSGVRERITQRWLSGDNQTRWIEASTFPVLVDGNSVETVGMILVDSTQKIEEDLAIRRYSSAMENIGEAIIILDMKGTIVHVNTTFEELFGFSKRDMKNYPVKALFPYPDRDKAQDILRDVRLNGAWKGKIVLLNRAGQDLYIILSASLVSDESDLPGGIVFSCMDVTTQERLLSELNDYRRELDILSLFSRLSLEDHTVKELAQNILDILVKSSGASSGFAVFYLDDSLELVAEKNLPVFISKFIEEIKRGRQSSGLSQAMSRKLPVFYSNISQAKFAEAKLLTRLGYSSMLAFRVLVGNEPLGLFALLWEDTYVFEPGDKQIYRAIARQISIMLQNTIMKDRLIAEASLIATGKAVSYISGDMKQILKGLETSQFHIDSNMREFHDKAFLTEWLSLSRQIWQLSRLTTNILDYNREFSELFFPVNITKVIQSCIDRITVNQFSKNLRLSVQNKMNTPEIYINEPVFRKVITNLLAISIDFAWAADSPEIRILLHDEPETYFVTISHNGSTFPDTGPEVEIHPKLAIPGIRCVGLAMSIVEKGICTHHGHLEITGNPTQKMTETFTVKFPRFPVIKSRNSSAFPACEGSNPERRNQASQT